MAKKTGRPAGFYTIVAIAAAHNVGKFLCADVYIENSASMCSWWRFVSRVSLAYFMLAGAALRLNKKLLHGLLLPIVPPPLPAKACVYASGVFEAIFGVLLLIPRMENTAAWAIIALLFAVFPANIYHAVSARAQQATGVGPPAVYFRIPIQAIFLNWAHWHTL